MHGDRRLLAVAGSLRRDSLNLALVKAAAEFAPIGFTVSIYPGLAAVPLFNEDLEGEDTPPAVQQFRQAVRSADGLLISTPEYNHSLPGVLKNAMDWLSRPGPDEVLIGKPVAVLGASSGKWGTRLAQAALRQILFATQSLVMPKPGIYLRNVHELFDENGGLRDGPTREALRAFMGDFAGWVDLVGNRSPSSA